MWYTHTYTQEYYSAIKKRWNSAICGNMDGSGYLMLSEISQTEKSKEPYDITHMWDIKLKETNEQARQTKKWKFIDIDTSMVVNCVKSVGR